MKKNHNKLFVGPKNPFQKYEDFKINIGKYCDILDPFMGKKGSTSWLILGIYIFFGAYDKKWHKYEDAFLVRVRLHESDPSMDSFFLASYVINIRDTPYEDEH